MLPPLRLVFAAAVLGCAAAGPAAAAPGAPPATAATDATPEFAAALAQWRRAPATPRRDLPLYEAAGRLDTAALRARLDELAMQNVATEAEWTPGRMLVEIWVERDAPAVFAWASERTDRQLRQWAEHSALTAWARKAPGAALAVAMDHRRQRLVDYTFSILEDYARSDPRGALATLDALPLSIHSQNWYAGVFRIWAERDPAAAAAAVLGPGPLRAANLRTVAETWSKNDPAAALAWAATLPDRDDRTSAAARALTHLAWRDPQAARAQLSHLPRGVHRDAVTMVVAAAWAQRDPEAALAWLRENHSGAALTLAQMSVFYLLTEREARSVLAYFRALPPELQASPEMIASLTDRLANGHLPLALDWAASLPDPARGLSPRQLALNRLLPNWAASYPRAAAAWLEQLPAGIERSRAMTDLTERWAQDDTLAALQWAESLPPGEERSRGLASVLKYLAQYEFQAAAEHTRRLGPLPASGRSEFGLADSSGRPVPLDQLLAEAARGSNPLVMRALLISAQSGWMLPLLRWLEQQPPGLERDQQLSAQINSLYFYVGLSNALALAATLQTESLRSQTMARILGYWAEHDPAVTLVALGNDAAVAGLNPELRADLERRIADRARSEPARPPLEW